MNPNLSLLWKDENFALRARSNKDFFGVCHDLKVWCVQKASLSSNGICELIHLQGSHFYPENLLHFFRKFAWLFLTIFLTFIFFFAKFPGVPHLPSGEVWHVSCRGGWLWWAWSIVLPSNFWALWTVSVRPREGYNRIDLNATCNRFPFKSDFR